MPIDLVIREVRGSAQPVAYEVLVGHLELAIGNQQSAIGNRQLAISTTQIPYH
ncbi:MAG: hypothetical protein ACR2H6_02320 [Pyrinomonadaceae bacterium]